MFHSQNKLAVFTCFFLLTSAITPETLFKKKGDDVVLDPDSEDPFITSTVWYHGDDMAADWDGADPEYYGPFKDRCSLNLFTGALTIRGLDGSEDGVFSVGINNKKLIMKTQLFVISKVPKPTISSEFNTDLTSCSLTCKGDTTGAGPVNYTWFTDGSESGSDKELKITTDAKGESFSCMMLNPVSNKSSDSFKNPMKEGERKRLISIVVPVVLTVLSVLFIVLVLFFIRRKNGRFHDAIGTLKGAEEGKPGDGSEVQQEPNHNGSAPAVIHNDVIKAHMKE